MGLTNKFKTIKKYARVLTLALATFVIASQTTLAQQPAEWVNPFIGTTNYGATFPGPIVPFGMVSVVPFNVAPLEGNEYSNTDNWCSNPYVYNNKMMTGFTHVNLSGVGCPDLGSIILMPTMGELEVDFNNYATSMSNEIAKAGYFSAHLDRYNIDAEASVTHRSGISRYTFNEPGQANILLNLGQGLTNESGALVKMVSDTEIEGYKLLGTFCYHEEAVFPVYFVAEFSKPANRRGYWKKQPRLPGYRHEWSTTSGQYKVYETYHREMAGDDIGSWYTFDVEAGEVIEVKVGVSYVSIENARENLRAEQDGFNLEKIAQDAFNQWNEKLSAIEVEGGTDDDKVMFYTALYHMLIHPTVFNDVNGQYPAMESPETATITNGNRHTVFSLWDTYRTVHPLLTLVYPQNQIDMINSMLMMYDEGGWLPKWELYSRETHVMQGDPALIVIADSWLRGLRDFDVEKAYEAMIKSATTEGKNNFIRPENDFYAKHYFVPFEKPYDNSVAQALELYVADYSLSQLAKALGKSDDHRKFYQRSLGYKKYFDKEYGLLRPVLADGSFMPGFDPVQGENFESVHGFHEGSSWQYSFAIPQDIDGLIRLHGRRNFVERLEYVFNEELYDMGNEPNMGYPYLFNFVKGEEWRTQKHVRNIINTYFGAGPDGLPGNDDTGTMSAWLMYGMMGFYPITPGNPVYTLSSPVFDKVTIHLDPKYYDNDKIVIETVNNSPENIYIQKMELGGRNLRDYTITHQDLVEKGSLKIFLGPNPKK
ncbi:MAG: glycoside hydrolase family 92 protein [Bacteroidetes bacterium]|nr:MAG: glycoside hydrolase family 92 protein [Bacteroidota bacterium]